VDSNHKVYDWQASFGRIDTILNQPDLNYQEVKELPDRDKLTFTNGFYANCSALFVDLRESSKLPSKMRRPTLARLYRAYISELVAIMNAHPKCREVNIVGDAVWAVINTPKKADIDEVFLAACRANSMIKALNCKLKKKSIPTVRAGIGMDWGRALMVKAGYAGSGINDVVYMGDVVNSAAKLAAKGDMAFLAPGPMMVGSQFRFNLNAENQGYLTYDVAHGCYTGSVVMTAMEDWRKANCT
jgi:class 3 adenylate cyclase